MNDVEKKEIADMISGAMAEAKRLENEKDLTKKQKAEAMLAYVKDKLVDLIPLGIMAIAAYLGLPIVFG